MSLQIFKEKIPSDILFILLDDLCVKTEKYYIFNVNSYKKGIFTEKINNFLNACKVYYFTSKQKYLERKVTYNNLMTVIRQICNLNNIFYMSKIKYSKSTYEIEYYIYFNV
jgi:hypothetical protein